MRARQVYLCSSLSALRRLLLCTYVFIVLFEVYFCFRFSASSADCLAAATSSIPPALPLALATVASMQAANVTIDDQSPVIVYSGGWNHRIRSDLAYSDDTVSCLMVESDCCETYFHPFRHLPPKAWSVYSMQHGLFLIGITQGSSATLSFECVAFSIFGEGVTDHGSFSVSIDGQDMGIHSSSWGSEKPGEVTGQPLRMYTSPEVGSTCCRVFVSDYASSWIKVCTLL